MVLVLDRLLPSDDIGKAMRSHDLLPNRPIGLKFDWSCRYVDLWLHQVLRELIPHGLVPLALHRFFTASGE